MRTRLLNQNSVKIRATSVLDSSTPHRTASLTAFYEGVSTPNVCCTKGFEVRQVRCCMLSLFYKEYLFACFRLYLMPGIEVQVNFSIIRNLVLFSSLN